MQSIFRSSRSRALYQVRRLLCVDRTDDSRPENPFRQPQWQKNKSTPRKRNVCRFLLSGYGILSGRWGLPVCSPLFLSEGIK